MLRLYLPPNLLAAASRGAIAVKLEFDSSVAPAPELLPALALLQRWCGTAMPPKFIQLSRAQFDELARSLAGQPVFFWLNDPAKAIAWDGKFLVGVPELPDEPAAAKAVAKGFKGGTAAHVATVPFRPRNASSAGTPALVDGSEHYLSVQLPSREHPSYGPWLELLKRSGFLLETSNRRYWLRDRHKALNFLAEHGARLREEWHTTFTENYRRNTTHLQEAEAVCSAEEARDGYSLTIALRAGQAGTEKIRSALASNCGYVEDQGRIYILDAPRMAKLAAAQKALSGDPGTPLAATRSVRVSALQVAEAQDVIEGISPNFQAPAAWRARSESLHSLTSLAPAPLSAGFAAMLRPYQRLGTAWLWFLQQQGLGGILADEMGLGKTLQALGLLSSLGSKGKTGISCASLVVAPASLLENWRREAARFVPELRVFVHHGDRRLGGVGELAAYDIIVTSYGTLVRDRELFEAAEFPCVVADEAQHIKNRRSQNARALRALKAKARFLLTGTPLENSLEDLRSLFEFLLPGYLPVLPPGIKNEDRTWHDERLLARTAPYILRRTKRDVAPELPAKIEQLSWCEMSPTQAALYRATQERSERELMDMEAGGASEARLRFAMLTQLLRLRQICCDPRIIGGAERAGPTGGSATDSDSAKLALLRELIDEALDDGHRVLVFSQFTSMLSLIGEALKADGIAFCSLDGSMTARARQAEVDRFQGSDSVPVFLLSLKAGGTGLNLTGADTVIHFDPWWNPAAEAQATDRAHRIGQTRAVTSYKLVCSGTVEEKVLALQEQKRALLADVFEASDAAAAKLELKDLRDLLAQR